MSKDIWHNKKEMPAKKLHCNRIIITKWGSCLDEIDIDNGATIETDWAFLDDLLALETENKDLSDKIGKLETELERTRNALEIATVYIKHTQTVSPFWFNNFANKTLDQIKTALEQKDNK